MTYIFFNEEEMMLKKSLVENVLAAALEQGGEFAEIFFENRKVNAIGMISSRVESLTRGTDYGIGIRIIQGLNTVYAYTNDLREENLIQIARHASAALNGGKKNLVFNFNKKERADYSPILIYPHEASIKERIDSLRMGSEEMKNYDEIITQTSANYADVDQQVLIANSENLWVQDHRVRSRIFLNAVATYGSEMQTGYSAPGLSKGFEFLRELDIKALAKETARTAKTLALADYMPSGKMTVIMDNAFGGVLFHEACGHGLEASFVSKDSSVYAGKMGQQIASPLVTAIDDGTIPNAWGTCNVDDEGTPTQRNVLIENGVLKSYLVDRLNGKRMGMKTTGSSRRESYKYAPTSRMNNTYIDKGESTLEEMIAGTEYGLYAKKLGGGSVDVVTGEFNFAVMEGYLVQNGKIIRPVRGASLIGKGMEVLQNIDMVGNNLELAAGMCGAESGSIPVFVGQPPVRIQSLTVGGR